MVQPLQSNSKATTMAPAAVAVVCELVGSLQDVAFHRCSLLLQELSVLHPAFLPKLSGLTETAYFEFLDAHRHAVPRKALARLKQAASPFVLLNETQGFLDGEDALLSFAATKTQLSVGELLAAAAFGATVKDGGTISETQLATAEEELETRAEAAVAESLFRYRHMSGHQFAFLVFTVDGVALPRVEIELFNDVCPRTCNNFLAFCQGRVPTDGGDAEAEQEGGAMLGYAGVPVHRIVRGGWIQTGDVTGQGSGDGVCTSLYGGAFPDESFAVSHNATGIVVRDVDPSSFGLCQHTNTRSAGDGTRRVQRKRLAVLHHAGTAAVARSAQR
jgi:cyclophilin family peptidyl-prolyl cis-trans isomerase